MKHTGWRKPTPGLGLAEKFAQAGEQNFVPKSQAFVAVKKVAAHIGLKAGDLLLLDTLGAFSQAQDWEAGRRPIVWPSNQYLMAQTGFSLSALKRHARRLAEIGVISFRDSPNGKRWGHRDADGVIVEAYGFDLSPLSARAGEFAELHARLLEERRRSSALRRQITVARRMIRARIEAALSGALRGAWAYLSRQLDHLLTLVPGPNAMSETLEDILGAFAALQERVEAAFLKAVQKEDCVVEGATETLTKCKNEQEMTPREVISEPHIHITTQLDPVTCNRSETEHAAGEVPETQAKEQDGPKPKTGIAVDLATIMQSCPEFAGWARNLGGYLQNWRDLHRAAGKLRPMIGISEQAWALAQDRLGSQAATAAFVLTFEKHCSGEVTSAGGYLRGMVQKAGAGELNLERSFYGRLSGQAA